MADEEKWKSVIQNNANNDAEFLIAENDVAWHLFLTDFP